MKLFHCLLLSLFPFFFKGRHQNCKYYPPPSPTLGRPKKSPFCVGEFAPIFVERNGKRLEMERDKKEIGENAISPFHSELESMDCVKLLPWRTQSLIQHYGSYIRCHVRIQIMNILPFKKKSQLLEGCNLSP